MQTHGYDRSSVWKQALALLDHLRTLTATFDNDPFGLAGKLRAIAVDLPVRAATAYEQLDYDSAKAHADKASQQIFQLWVQAQLAQHLGLLTPRQLNDLRRRLDTLDDAFAELPDELFEDDDAQDLSDAA